MPSILVAGIDVEIVRKDIKHLHLGVYPPDGRVRVSTPLRVNDEAVRLAVIDKLAWLKQHREAFLGQERQSARECISRESHFYFGHRYLLELIEEDGPTRVKIQGKTRIVLRVSPNSDVQRREEILNRWYRRELKAVLPSIIERWEEELGVEVAFWGVKKMKTKWGSCNPKTGRIWVNLELAKKPIQCLEYIVVHEMVHLLERKHNNEFRALMDHFFPQWRLIRDVLNSVPLAHQTWSY